MIDILTKARLELQNPNLWEFFLQSDVNTKYYVQEVNLPFFKFATESQLPYAKFYSKLEELDDISVTFYETEDFAVTKFLEEWMDTVYDSKKRVWKLIDQATYTQKYKGILAYQRNDRQLVFENSIGYEKSIGLTYNKAYRFINMKIKGIENFDNSYGQTDPFTVKATFSVDDIERMNTNEVPGANFLG